MDRNQQDLDNHANQMNPNNDAYWSSRGEDGRPDGWDEGSADDKGGSPSQADLDNHANQLNPNNDEYDRSRGGSG